MTDFAVIPVLDLMNGEVVHGRAGDRASYQAIETPFGAATDPLAIAGRLLSLTQSEALYVADLDAIENRSAQTALVGGLTEALNAVDVWLDSGIATPKAGRRCEDLGATPVIGSESLATLAQWTELSERLSDPVLSLDFGKNGFRGPKAILNDPQLWPKRVIVMTLGRVGMDEGPDLERLREIAGRAGKARHVYAAGGFRGIADLEAAAMAGAQGALIATALHRGRIGQKEIAAFVRRQRSRD